MAMKCNNSSGPWYGRTCMPNERCGACVQCDALYGELCTDSVAPNPISEEERKDPLIL